MVEPGIRGARVSAPLLPPVQVSRWNIANLLTMIRLVLVLPFVLALFAAGGHSTGWRALATALFTVAALTDRFDGQVARRYGWVTDLGKFVDPLADKALTGSALIGLSVLGLVPWWLTVVIVVREVLVTVLRSVLARIAAMPATRGGKLKTLLLTVGLGLVLLPFGAHGVVHGVGIAVLVLAAVVSTVTGVDYVLAGRRLWAGRGARRRT
jgi:CDP-diacylglycerol--glycerol-3-phosphate 3-phosphatidyltransferase